MAQENCPPPVETSLTDRAILLHILAHVEELDAGTALLIEDMGRLRKLEEEFRPLLNMLKPNGQPDMLAVAQARRGVRKARRGT